ncbi:sensor histidine kinase [Actinophytocola sp.]|uniref:sensor histidine kinase n=1 Tax=Actinophytocola sp. TaxID=1872138 RepID=UPI002ED86241
MAGLLGVLVRPSTYRRWVYLVLGGAVLVPFMLLAATVLPSILPEPVASQPLLVVALTLALVFGAMVLMAFIPAVRVIEGTAARELLGDRVPEHATRPATSWPSRWLGAGWFVLHLLAGGVVGVLTLTLPPTVAVSLATPFTGRLNMLGIPLHLPTGWAGVWVPAAGLVALLVLVHVVAGSGALFCRLAPQLLGPTAAERLVELERRTEQLAERNRLARELHDSVGHALSVVTIQASAAGRVLDNDPEFARKALGAIEESARAALADLDHVLGLLREERAATSPQWTLADLPRLLDKTRIAGVELESTVEGTLADVPPAVSREAYRIVQEGLTNVLRHAGKVPVALRLVAGDDRLELDLSNPLAERAGRVARAGGGHGLSGMRERVTVLRGQMTAGAQDGRWHVSVRIPLRTTTGTGG